jgi:hypothetical protein
MPSRNRLIAYLASLLGNRHDAEAVFQQASVTMWLRGWKPECKQKASRRRMERLVRIGLRLLWRLLSADGNRMANQ